MKILKSLCCFFVLFLCAFQSIGQEKNILIIHSYHEGLEWTDNISEGIKSVYNGKFQYNLFTEYLDTKRNYSEDYFIELKKLFELKTKGKVYDGIIASDNAALEFIIQHKHLFAAEIPKVYCGINNPEVYLSKLEYTDIIVEEKADHYGTLKSIDQLLPNVDTVLIINDKTLSGKSILNEVMKVLPKFKDRFHFQFFDSFTKDEINPKLTTLSPKHAIYLLVLNRDVNGEFISYNEGITRVREASKVPIFGAWEFYLGKGIVGGNITSGKKQGAFTANILFELLEGSTTIDEVKSKKFKGDYCFDYNELVKWNIDQKNLPANAKIINPPVTHPFQKILYTLIIVFAITLLLFFVVLTIKKKTRDRLEKTVRERTLELEDTIKKKDEFFSILAHDLRGPLGNITTVSKMLIDKKSPIKSEKKQFLLSEMVKLSVDTFDLLEDILIWGRLQFQSKPHLTSEQVQIDALFQEIEQSYNIGSQIRIFNYDNLESFSFTSDAFIIKFIARNLVQNAIKFSDNESTIEIGSEKNDKCVKFWVKDYGIGISENELEAIMQKKPIQKSGTQGQKSFGLGLSVVLQYIEQINGKLSIESSPRKGAKFIVEIGI